MTDRLERTPTAAGSRVVHRQRRVRAARRKGLWLLISAVGMGLLFPWMRMDNAEEVAAAQGLVDEMGDAYRSVVAGEAEIEAFTTRGFGFEGMETATASGVPAWGFIGRAGDDCLIMHWTEPGQAQVGRLPADWKCSPESVVSVPLAAHDGYVAGKGPPFDVTALIREAWTPLWAAILFVILAAIGLKALVDLGLLLLRPDQYFADL